MVRFGLLWPPTIVGGHRLIAEGGKKDPNKAGKMTIKKESYHL
ncbi:hypothetical protein SBF1_4780001 [Candidatus Desulfosporosinus infrequens]|uniref:Uncharacterized protein n=1 Tax=Candidatus Desulfosporosinus infrequens TaxID=2043169 RepID=A0A2U3LEX6_9FIRM|nr:hypothetical protein SBF1_4780001 [Candidatus Desulfosporosinus infrequens]